MSTGTVLLRELAIVARSPANYRMRTVVGFWATVYLGGALIQLGNRNDAGAQIFTVINGCAFFLLIVLGAIASADSISKERREGTLDLLFLTHLNARDIVHAKFTCGLFRVLTSAWVLVPISTASMLVGGVNKGDILRTILMQCAAVLIGLASGVLASSFCRNALPAMVLSILLAVVATSIEWIYLRLQGAWSGAVSNALFTSMLAANAVLTLCGTYLALSFAANRVKAARVTAGESERTLWFRNVFLTPHFWKGAFRRSMRRMVERNPLVWLEYRSAWRRSARWLLVLALIFAETNYVMMSDRTSGLMSFQVILGFAMILFVGVTSASSFKVEKESGAFELLLVAPISEETLIINRIKAVWAYYAPVFLTWIAFLGFVSANFPSTSYGLRAFVGSALLSIVLSMVTLPLAGLYFAIRLKNFISILLLTLCFGAVLPFFTWIWVTMAFYLFAYGSAFLSYRSSFPFEALVIGSHYFLALKFYNSVRDYLKARNFA